MDVLADPEGLRLDLTSSTERPAFSALGRERARERDAALDPGRELALGPEALRGDAHPAGQLAGRASRTADTCARVSRVSVSPRSTRTISPPRLLAATAMWPATRKARPPNIRFSSTPASPREVVTDPVGEVLVEGHHRPSSSTAWTVRCWPGTTR